ncbi:MAG TPA: very short patch repair endonuclease [Thermoanaerobaculia bacterium]|nr:very short patch repair endonuclease [Thermoanaerobaculia bacterium]
MPKVPRFSSFVPASETTSRIKQRNRSRDTKAELLLRKELWRRGLRYRLHAADLPGKPDLVFRRARVVVFCDGDFWHGRRLRERQERLSRGTNAPYWTAKIAANAARDRRNTRMLRAAGWTVVRLWETDILRDLERAAGKVARALNAPL